MFRLLKCAAAVALLLAPSVAMADPWKDETGRGWGCRGGDYKQEWSDGRCKYERKWDDGEYKEEMKCDGPRRHRYQPRVYYERPPDYYYERLPVVVASTPPPGITVTIPFD